MCLLNPCSQIQSIIHHLTRVGVINDTPKRIHAQEDGKPERSRNTDFVAKWFDLKGRTQYEENGLVPRCPVQWGLWAFV